jgi:hypothetical protein
MAVQTDLIVIGNGTGEIFRIPDIDFIRMRIMAFPAGKCITMRSIMNTLLKFPFDFLEMISCELFVVPMTIDAVILALHPELLRMGECVIFCCMTINACKAPVIGGIKLIPENNPVTAHHAGNFPAAYLVKIGVFGASVTTETPLILVIKF